MMTYIWMILMILMILMMILYGKENRSIEEHRGDDAVTVAINIYKEKG